MLDYEISGYMSVVTTPGTYFIPHHPVFKGDLKNAKLRVVFDASAAVSSGRSLNQCLHVGSKLQQDIVDVLLCFRVHLFTFTADICQMYRQILLLLPYRSFQHIFWRPTPLDKLTEFCLNTVTYGLTCAPFLTLRVLQDMADQDCVNLSEIQNALRYQAYVLGLII